MTEEERGAVRGWIGVGIIGVLFVILMLVCGGCANQKEWKRVVTEDHIKNITTTELFYREDTGFDLGTEGLGEYYLFKVEGF